MLVTVAIFFDPWEAHIVRARLDADGIPAIAAFANHAIANWPMALALGGTRVQVPAPFLAQARQTLADYWSGAFERELNEACGCHSECCPRCGSTDFLRTMPRGERLSAFLIMACLAAFPTSRRLFICKRCGCRWQWGED